MNWFCCDYWVNKIEEEPELSAAQKRQLQQIQAQQLLKRIAECADQLQLGHDSAVLQDQLDLLQRLEMLYK